RSRPGHGLRPLSRLRYLEAVSGAPEPVTRRRIRRHGRRPDRGSLRAPRAHRHARDLRVPPMTAARILTVASAPLAGADPTGRFVSRALLGEGVPVATRQVVDETESALESALAGGLDAGDLVVVLA